MIHEFLRFSLKLVFWIYYRKVQVSGLENFPAHGPVILACNHPNSFLDALLVGTYTKRRLFFLARSDVFNSPLKRWILETLSLLPVYRLQEGMENVDKNRTTFSKCFEILDKDALILIFSEGLCIQEMRLRPLKKGTARIALEYVRDGKQLAVVPVGLNYLKPRTACEEVLLDFGNPFAASDFAASYASNPGRAINDFNKVLESRLRISVINIRDKAHDHELTQVIQLERNEGKDLNALVKSANDFDALRVANPERYWKLVELSRLYTSRLASAGIDDRTIKDQKRFTALWWTLSPVYWLGRLLNGLPFITAKWLADTKVSKVEFYDSVFLGAFMFVNQFHNIFVALIMLVFHPFLSIVIPGVLLLTGAFTSALHDPLRMNSLRRRRDSLSKADLDELRNLRQDLVQQRGL